MRRAGIVASSRRLFSVCGTSTQSSPQTRRSFHDRTADGQQNTQKKVDAATENSKSVPRSSDAKQNKTIAQLDKELEEKLAGRTGDGGSAGVEYEDGRPVSMKRSVKNNMFRYI